jgi:hypothetical protein
MVDMCGGTDGFTEKMKKGQRIGILMHQTDQWGKGHFMIY